MQMGLGIGVEGSKTKWKQPHGNKTTFLCSSPRCKTWWKIAQASFKIFMQCRLYYLSAISLSFCPFCFFLSLLYLFL